MEARLLALGFGGEGISYKHANRVLYTVHNEVM